MSLMEKTLSQTTKYGVIDIGSNSVRLMISDGQKSLYKILKITRLAENVKEDCSLSAEAIKRTAEAVSFFVLKAKSEGVKNIFAFATAAVRKAPNRQIFLDLVKNLCGISVDVISGEVEAELGLKGALKGKNGGIIDIGGASTEIIVSLDGSINYFKSLYVGTVFLKNNCGQEEKALSVCIDNIIKDYGAVPDAEFFGIGGTATSVASLMQELESYDSSKVDGYVIKYSDLKILKDKLFSLSIEEKKMLKGLQSERADVIAGGVLLLLKIMEKLSLSHVTVSESDNLEGYLLTKVV